MSERVLGALRSFRGSVSVGEIARSYPDLNVRDIGIALSTLSRRAPDLVVVTKQGRGLPTLYLAVRRNEKTKQQEK